ncbi:acetyl-CoA C-acyltransferase [Rhodococcus opacus]|nr:acetyl-CoA C-acyltransferase [Rhodococcus opacus]
MVGGARTPVGGSWARSKISAAPTLRALAIKAVLERTGVAAADIDYVVMRQVLTAGTGQIPARRAATAAGLPMSVSAVNVNKVCLSRIDSIVMADMLIRAGIFHVVVAGGQESMTNAPHLLPKSRTGHKYGAAKLLDHLEWDDLWTASRPAHGSPDRSAQSSTRPDLQARADSFAVDSHTKAAARPRTVSSMTKLCRSPSPGKPDVRSDAGRRCAGRGQCRVAWRARPAFHHSGTVTAGSASQLSDGACAVVVMNKAVAERRGLRWLAEITGHGFVARPDSTLQSHPRKPSRPPARPRVSRRPHAPDGRGNGELSPATVDAMRKVCRARL